MFTENDVRELAEFQAGSHLVTSLYFHPPKIQDRTRRQEPGLMKDLFRRAQEQWNHGRLDGPKLESLRQDSRRITEFLAANTDGEQGRTDYALFACSALGYLKTFPLRRGFSHWGRSSDTTLSIGETFCLRPLVELIDAYPRQCVVTVGREEGRVYIVTNGELQDRRSVHDQTPGRVKERSFGGYEGGHFQRHVETEVHRHYQNVLDEIVSLFRKRRFERLSIGGHKEAMADFEAMLPEDLKRRMIGRFVTDPHHESAEPVIQRALEVAREHDRAQKQRLVQEVLDGAGPMGRGVVGLDAVLNALLKREVQVLLIGDGCCAGGKRCNNCGFLGAVSLADCPSCGQHLNPVEDLIDESVRRAVLGNAQVRFVTDIADFQRAGNVGAILRFRAERKLS